MHHAAMAAPPMFRPVFAEMPMAAVATMAARDMAHAPMAAVAMVVVNTAVTDRLSVRDVIRLAFLGETV